VSSAIEPLLKHNLLHVWRSLDRKEFYQKVDIKGKSMSCRMCDSKVTVAVGALPEVTSFAGIRYPDRFKTSNLVRCVDCESMQREPVEQQADYTELYSKAAAGVWAYENGRLDFAQIVDFLKSQKNVSSVLDIGSGSGDLLSMLPESWRKSAVEPSPGAQKILKSKSIELVGTDMMSIPKGQHYSAVTLVDIVEHVVQPKELLVSLSAIVESGGYLIIVTGDPTIPVWWKKMKSGYWYSAPQEHLSFPSCKSIVTELSKHNFKLEHFNRFRRKILSKSGWIISSLLQYSYAYVPELHQLLMMLLKKRKYGWQLKHYTHIYSPGLFEDHQLIILKKS
jgi:SAM-dependent methyltransferase